MSGNSNAGGIPWIIEFVSPASHRNFGQGSWPAFSFQIMSANRPGHKVMRRRDLLALAGLAALTPSTGLTQQAGRTYRLGFVAQQPRGGYAVLLEELGRLGFAEGRNLSVDPRGVGLLP